MLPLQSIEAPPPGTADENGETRQQKPKTLPCKYCSKRFRLVATSWASPFVLRRSHIDLHCLAILGVWNMSRDMREPIPRKSPLLATGTDVEKHLDGGEFASIPFQSCLGSSQAIRPALAFHLAWVAWVGLRHT